MASLRSAFAHTGVSLHLALIFCLAVLTPACSKKESAPHATASPTPSPTPFIPRKIYETAKLFNGITLKSTIEATPTDSTALELEATPGSYTLHLDLHLQIPKPATTTNSLLAATPSLATLLPNLDQLLTNSIVSPDYAALFENKEKRLRADLGELHRLLPIDTLYDCQSILNLQNPDTARHAILIQALMNVNADGSDGDRNLPTGPKSAFFQPQTNYRWPKATAHPNPYLDDTLQRIKAIKEKLTSEDLSMTEKASLRAQEDDDKATLAELKRWSFLVGTADPFIVLPSFMCGSEEGKPQIGDYVIVIADDTLYPAIVGDKGPSFKMGEASLRLCKEIDDSSTADIRPVDHPKVAYLVFPGTADKPFSSPDYKHWSDRCHSLWKEFGGSDSANWQEWKSLEKPWPTPTPTPTPSPTPVPTPSPESSPASTSGTNPAATLSPQPSPVVPSPSTNLTTNPTPKNIP
jgi:hypothetical protein